MVQTKLRKTGSIKISKFFVHDALRFPLDWEIETLKFSKFEDVGEMIISGPEFPETEEGSPIPECKIIIHKEFLRFEVKKIEEKPPETYWFSE